MYSKDETVLGACFLSAGHFDDGALRAICFAVSCWSTRPVVSASIHAVGAELVTGIFNPVEEGVACEWLCTALSRSPFSRFEVSIKVAKHAHKMHRNCLGGGNGRLSQSSRTRHILLLQSGSAAPQVCAAATQFRSLQRF